MRAATIGVSLIIAGCLGEPSAVAEPKAVLDADERGLPNYLSCLQDQGVALVSAHRGGPAPGYPENAIASFDRVLAAGPMLLEVDVRTTSDGVLVLMHDRELERTTTCSGRLVDTQMAALRNCRLKDNDGGVTEFSVPILADALAWAKDRAILQLDVKARETFPATLELVKQADAFDRVVFITYAPGTAAMVAELHGEAVISTTIETMDEVDRLAESGLSLDRLIAWVGYGEEKRELVAQLDARGVMANFGTLGFGDSLDDQFASSGNDQGYRDIAESGVDLIASDRPLAAYAALARSNDPVDEIALCNRVPDHE